MVRPSLLTYILLKPKRITFLKETAAYPFHFSKMQTTYFRYCSCNSNQNKFQSNSKSFACDEDQKLNPLTENCDGEDDQNTKQYKRNLSYMPLIAFIGLSAFVYELFSSKCKLLDNGNESKKLNRQKHNFIADIVSDVSPTVVHVERKNPFGARSSKSTGSGFIIKKDGLIITNAHVAGDQSHLTIRLQDGTQYIGKVVAVDGVRDMAAVKINCNDLPIVPLGQANDLRVGEWVIAFGSPLSLKNTATIGIVSNMFRVGKELGLNDMKSGMTYIQTDATINVGNSGGPLVNLAGEVIGMNTLMASAGIGFAIPVAYVNSFVKSLKNGGFNTQTKECIGVRVLSLTKDFIEQVESHIGYNLQIDKGLFVDQVVGGSLADVAGLKGHDVILSINDQDVFTPYQMLEALKDNKTVKLTVKRKKSLIDVTIHHHHQISLECL